MRQANANAQTKNRVAVVRVNERRDPCVLVGKVVGKEYGGAIAELGNTSVTAS